MTATVSPGADKLLEVRGLKVHFSLPPQTALRAGAQGACRRRRVLRHRARRDAGPGRRIRLGQDDDRARRHAPRAGDRGQHSAERRRTRAACPAKPCAASAATCRSSSRIRIRRSIRACAPARSSARRSTSSTSATGKAATTGSPNCSALSACARSSRPCSRTSSPAASASASAWRARWRPSRT